MFATLWMAGCLVVVGVFASELILSGIRTQRREEARREIRSQFE